MLFKQKNKSFMRVCALILIEAMLFSNAVYANEDLKISRFYGKVLEKYEGDGDRVIVHIKDAHCNFDAQNNTYKILKSLESQGLKL